MVPLAKVADQSWSWKEASKSRVSSFLWPFLYKRIEKWHLLGHIRSYQLILSTILLLMCVQFKWYKTNHVRQHGHQLQMLDTKDTDKPEDADFIISFPVHFSIHKNDFYTKRKLLSKAFFWCIAKTNRIRHASSHYAFFSTCIINLL